MSVGAPTPDQKRPSHSHAVPQFGWVQVRRRGKLLFEYHPGLNWVRIKQRGIIHIVRLDRWLEN